MKLLWILCLVIGAYIGVAHIHLPSSTLAPQGNVLAVAVSQPNSPDSVGDKQLETINKVRIASGSTQLQFDVEIDSVARQRTTEMVSEQYYAHERKDGTYFDNLFSTAKKHSCENLQLQTGNSIEKAVQAWIDSPSHKKCLLSPSLSKAAVSVTEFMPGSGGTTNQKTYLFAFIAAS